MWHPSFDGYPADEFIAKLNPRLPALRRVRSQTFRRLFRLFRSRRVGTQVGLPEDTVVSVGAFDAHMGCGGRRNPAHQLLKVMGTSTCDRVMVVPRTTGSRNEYRDLGGRRIDPPRRLG